MVGADYLMGQSLLELQGGKVEKFTCMVDLRAFYMEMHDVLVAKGFKDVLQPGGYAKAGEWVHAGKNLNRTGDIFEKEFITIEHGSKREVEIRWEAVQSIPTSVYGSIIFKLDLVCRNIQDKEILVGNEKKIMQSGGWEFRNSIIYQNTILKDFLQNIPFVKNFPMLQQLYLEKFYEPKVNEDIFEFLFPKTKAAIYGVIHKHFA